MEWLSILLLAALAMCIYKIWAANNKKSANEREFVEDHDAQTARLKQEHQEQLRAAHAERDLEKRANGSLRHENSTLAAAANRRGREQREIERQRREIYDLKEELSDATYDRSTVETASIVKEQWTSISDTLAKAGFVAKTPNDLARSIESLLELRDSAAASPNQAALDKKELANEKAAKEAAQRKLRKAEDTIRQKDSTIATLNEQKDAEIAALRADLKKTEMNGPTTSSLQQELSQTKAALAEAQKKINFLQTEGDALLEKHESIMTEGRASHGKHESLKTEGQALYENYESAVTEGQALREKHNKLCAAFNALVQTARECKQNEESLKLTVRDLLATCKKRSQTQLSTHRLKLKGQKGKKALLRKKVAKLTSDVAARDQQVTKLSIELADAMMQNIMNDWNPPADDPSFANPSYNNGAYGNLNDTANGFNVDLSLLAAASLGNNGTNQNSAFDFTTPGPQDGADFTFPDNGLDGLNNNGSFSNQDFSASMAIGDLNAYDSSGNAAGSSGIQTSSAPDHMGSFDDNSLIGLLNLDDGDAYDGSNINGELGNMPDLGDLNGSSDPNTNGGFQLQQNRNPAPSSDLNDPNTTGGFQNQQDGTPAPSSALNGSSGLNTTGGFQPQQNGNQDPSSAINALSGLNTSGAFQPQQSGNPAPSSSFSFGNSGPAPSGAFTFATKQDIVPDPSNSFTTANRAQQTQTPINFPFAVQTSSQPGANATIISSLSSGVAQPQQNGVPALATSLTLGAQPAHSQLGANGPIAPIFSSGAAQPQQSGAPALAPSLIFGAQPPNNQLGANGTTIPVFSFGGTQPQQNGAPALATSLVFGAQPANSQLGANGTTIPIFSSGATQPAQPPGPQTTSSLSAPQCGTGQKRASSPAQNSSSNSGSANAHNLPTENEIKTIKYALDGTVAGVDPQELHQVMVDNYDDLDPFDTAGVDVFELPPNVQRLMLNFVIANRTQMPLKVRRRRPNTSA